MPDPAGRPLVTLGLLAPVVIVATGAILSAEVLGRQSGPLIRVLGNLGLRWLGERALSIYVWHVLFGIALETRGPGPLFDVGWPGASVFVIQLVFALAAGATSYRYLQVPFRTGAERLTPRPARGRRGETITSSALRTT